MRKRWLFGAAASVAGFTAVLTFLVRDPEPRRVVAPAAQASDIGATSLPAATVADLPIDTDMRAKLKCLPVPPEMDQIPGIRHDDSPAYSGYVTPKQALAAAQADQPAGELDLEMTGVNRTMARFENGRAILLATLGGDGLWSVTESNRCWDY